MHFKDLKESRCHYMDFRVIPLIDIVASCSLGAAQRSIELAKDHVTNRKQFGQTLDNFQVIYKVIIICHNVLFQNSKAHSVNDSF